MEVQTQTIAEAGEAQEAVNETLVDMGFVPMAPLNAQPPAYEAGATYALNALVTDGTQVYRSQAAGNKGNTPHEDADFVHWAPVSISIVPLVNPNWNHAATAGAGLGE